MFQSQNTELNPNLPTVLFCNPNACFYEYLSRQSEWMQYYMNLGVNLVIWNYRGYGRSGLSWKGMSPQAIQRDSEYVLQHVQSNLVLGKVGVHGESLGGSIANFLAKKSELTFVFVDRTFSSLQHVAYWTFGGNIVVKLLNLFTCGWRDNGLENFFEILPSTYKLLGADPDDKIIRDLASLKCSVARKLVQD